MHPRALSAGVLAIGIGATALPTDASAGAAAHVAAPSFMARSAVRQTVAPHVAASPVRPLVRKPVNNDFRPPMNRIGFSQFRGPRENGFPFWWTDASGAAYNYPGYYPSEYLPSYEPPATAYPPTENYPPQNWPVVPGCRTDTQKVPSERGGEATVKIVRCY